MFEGDRGAVRANLPQCPDNSWFCAVLSLQTLQGYSDEFKISLSMTVVLLLHACSTLSAIKQLAGSTC